MAGKFADQFFGFRAFTVRPSGSASGKSLSARVWLMITTRPAPMHNSIVIKGAREHKLKNIDVTIPRDRLVVITDWRVRGRRSLPE